MRRNAERHLHVLVQGNAVLLGQLLDPRKKWFRNPQSNHVNHRMYAVAGRFAVAGAGVCAGSGSSCFCWSLSRLRQLSGLPFAGYKLDSLCYA